MRTSLNPKIERFISKLSTLKHAVVVTQNKKPESSENFAPEGGNSNVYRNGFWISRPPASTEVSAGVHFQKSPSGQPNLIWCGRWLEPQQEVGGARWIFRLSHVKGPYQTYSSFEELFGVRAQATFVYMRKVLPASKRAAMDLAAARVQDKLIALLNSLAKIPLTGDEKTALVKRRLGHGALREAVHALFDSTCCLTGITNRSLLVCSHIKPWSTCTPQEKVAHQNTLLLAANWDAAFDKGLIGFDHDGTVVRSAAITRRDASHLGLDLSLRLPSYLLSDERRDFLKQHLTQVRLQGRR